jgi:type II pantothenate kinase
LIPNADPTQRSAGVDVGTRCLKLALRAGDALELRILPSTAIEQAAREIEAFDPQRLGLTGTGAATLAPLLTVDTVASIEFEAWHAGATLLLAQQGAEPIERDLLISLGTGTSMLLVEPGGSTRVGGTALGGGTLAALGAALADTADPAQLVALASQGERRNVDLTLADVDPSGSLSLSSDFTAAFLAKLDRNTAAPADIAHALVGMVAETVGTLASAVAAAVQARRILYGGGTLRDNAPLRDILAAYSFAGEHVFLQDGEFTGALGAIELADRHA